jgi:hypothetical protein
LLLAQRSLLLPPQNAYRAGGEYQQSSQGFEHGEASTVLP